MRIPKLVRGTRERGFFAEIAVIVIGVLIALAAGQLLEEWNWGRKVDAGKQQLLQEARINIEFAAEQVAVQPCLNAQLETLRDRVLSSGASLEPAPIHEDDTSRFVFRAPSRPYPDNSWQALLDDGTSVHMKDQQREALTGIYSAADVLNHLGQATDLTKGRLMTLSHALPLDAGTRVMFVASLDEQQARSNLQSLAAAQMLVAYRAFGASFPDSGDALLADSGTVAFCRKHKLPVADWLEVIRAPSE